MISKEYNQALKQRIIKDFVKANSRAPSNIELQALIKDYQKDHEVIDQIGFSGFELVKPKFRQEASASEENVNRKALHDDWIILNKKLDRLVEEEENAYYILSANIRKTNKLLNLMEKRLENLLSHDDYLSGIEEDFSIQDLIDFDTTTAFVNPMNVTLGSNSLGDLDLSRTKIKITPVSRKGFLSWNSNNAAKTLFKSDGEYLAEVRTSYQIGRVSLLIEIEFPQLIKVSSIVLSGLPLEVNTITTITCLSCVSNDVFVPVIAEQRFTDDMLLPLNIKQAKKLRVLLSKEASDSFDELKNEYLYQFLLDQIKIKTNDYETKKSIFFAGPYPVLDSDGNAVNFTKAKFSACTIEPSGTGVSFFLSKDQETYYPCNHLLQGSNYVTFGDNTPSQALDYVDDTLASNQLVEEISSLESFTKATDAYLNSFIISDYASKVSSKSVTLHRNVVGETSESGWTKGTTFYSTIVYIINPEGRTIDLGPKGAVLNGKKVTGFVKFSSGYNRFQTDQSNWIESAEGAVDENALKALDSLYPYNHKYLIEGYPYLSSFTGNKVYNSVDKYFGRDMEYISNEQFDVLELTNKKYWTSFTIEEVDGNLYFKVKVDKKSSLWRDELFDLDFFVASGEGNNLYVKAILSTDEAGLTPVIQSYKVRLL